MAAVRRSGVFKEAAIDQGIHSDELAGQKGLMMAPGNYAFYPYAARKACYAASWSLYGLCSGIASFSFKTPASNPDEGLES